MYARFQWWYNTPHQKHWRKVKRQMNRSIAERRKLRRTYGADRDIPF